MKITKKQANAVRSYLATLGMTISHVQALEVIARGAGHRSRHVTAAAVDGSPLTRAPQCCTKCDTDLSPAGYCKDLTCVYSDWPQTVPQALFGNLPTPVIEALYGVSKRVEGDSESDEDSQAQELLSESIKQAYHDSGCQRSDLEEAVQRLVTECADLFEGEEAAVMFLHEEPEMLEASDVMPRAQEIKAEYDSSRCHADDVDHAVRRLMVECPGLFTDDRKAWSFINDEQHEELEGCDFLAQVESDLFGNEVFPYYTEEERRAGVVRLMAKAVELNDGVTRRYYFTDIDSDIEKNSSEYDQALQGRDLEGEIVDSVVFYQGTRIGTIADITESELTLYSWIDENP